MTHLNIQQGLNIEVVSTNLIKKLYEAALSVPEPLEGELDAAYTSGNLLVGRAYRALVEYLTNRFDDLHINVTDSYYIPFEDSAVLNVLLANNIGSDGIGVTEAEAANATFTSSTFQGNTDITSFNGFKYFTKANNNPPENLFKNCTSLTSIDLSNVTAFSNGEFRNTRIPNVTIPSSVTKISMYGFALNGSLTTVTAPNILIIERDAFDSCSSLTSFSDFSKVTEIGQSAFAYSRVSGILNCPNLTSLGSSAFGSGHRFQGIECLGTISSINGAFGHNGANGNSSLLYAYIPYECTELNGGAFARNQGLSVLKQYDKTISAYQEGETKTFLSNLSKITKFGNECFRECRALSLTGADIVNATEIGGFAFLQTPLSGAISLPHLTSIGNNAFDRCTGITSVDLTGSTITSIPQSCFSGCTALTSVTMPSTVTSIGSAAFLNVNITSGVMNLLSVISLGTSPFTNCKPDQFYMPALLNTASDCYFTTNSYFVGAFTNNKDKRFICDLMYFKDLQKIYTGSFCLISSYALIVNNTTPPIWANTNDVTDDAASGTYKDRNRMFKYSDISTKNSSNVPENPSSSTIKVYVPNSAVTTYQNDSLWGTYCTILPISDLNSGVIYATEADWTTAGKPVGLIAEYLGLSTADLATFVSANNLTYYVAPSS